MEILKVGEYEKEILIGKCLYCDSIVKAEKHEVRSFPIYTNYNEKKIKCYIVECCVCKRSNTMRLYEHESEPSIEILREVYPGEYKDDV